MILSITNEHRRCMGIEEINDSWECIEATNGALWYFDKDDVIRKVIEASDDRYFEYSLAARTTESRTRLCPETSRGKMKNLTPSAVEAASRHGAYIFYYKDSLRIGNYTNQLDYYWGACQAGEKVTPEEFPAFLDRWVSETDDREMELIREFAFGERKRIRYCEGDIFRVRFDRKRYGYGQILFDIWKYKRSGHEIDGVTGGHELIAQLFRIVTEDRDMSVESVLQYPRLPSRYIRDNNFLYGDYEIIGHAALPEEPDYPIVYGRSRSALKPHTTTFECGPIHLDIPDSEHSLIENPHCEDVIEKAYGGWSRPTLHWTFFVTPENIETCIKADSNESLLAYNDLRTPQNAEYRRRILEQIGMSDLDRRYSILTQNSIEGLNI